MLQFTGISVEKQHDSYRFLNETKHTLPFQDLIMHRIQTIQRPTIPKTPSQLKVALREIETVQDEILNQSCCTTWSQGWTCYLGFSYF
jgi:hypothetical protein